MARSHNVAVLVQVLSGGTPVYELPVSDGSVTLDSSASIRGRCDLTVPDGSLVPTGPSSLLAPYGNELRVYRGVRYADGNRELVSLGIFRIEEVTTVDGESGLELRVAGLDRAKIMEEAAFEEPYSVASGTLATTAILNVVQSVMPGVITDFSGISVQLPELVEDEGQSKWAFAQGIATAIGAELYFDGDAVLKLRPIPSPIGDPVAYISEGEDGVLIEVDKRWHREETVNRVFVTGENTGALAPVRGVATDDNPNSPTRYGGPFGVKPQWFSEYSQFIGTQNQANDAAAGILASRLGTTQQLNFGAIVDPSLEPSDVVQVKRERLSLNQKVVLDSLTIPLDPASSMSASTRATQVFT